MKLPIGTLLHSGTYRIERDLGQGSFGITYLATHAVLGYKVAIKEFFMKELNSRESDGAVTGINNGSLAYNYAQKFKKEAQNLSQLDHSNIVKVTDYFEENGTYYYVMNFIEGTNLNEFISTHRISEQEAIDIISKVADALIYMHEERHMLHLDLKPGNIMRRSSDGHIFLIDFGLSKHYTDNGKAETSTTIGQGTSGYAPIEQANQAKNGEFRPTIDVYALGASLYKLLTGETPPAASELVSDMTLLPNKLMSYGISNNLANFIVKSMMPNVRMRIQNMKEFKHGLHALDEFSQINDINDSEANNEETIVQGSENVQNISPSLDNVSKKSKFSSSKTKIFIISCIILGSLIGIFCYNKYREDLQNQQIVINEQEINGSIDFYVTNEGRIYCTIDDTKRYVETIPNGYHRLHYASNDKENRKVYQGDFSNGQRNAVNASMEWNNGDVYRGSFANGNLKSGTYSVKSDGSYFTGDFKNNSPYNGKWYSNSGKYLQTVSNGY